MTRGTSELPAAGAKLGEYELAELLGMGGFGAVYRAHQPRLARDVAIKIVTGKPDADIDDLARRFMREIDLVRRLEHPNIVRMYDFGQTDDGTLWMAMELVRGKSLQELLLTEKRISTARARRIGMQMLSGLSSAHEQTIVHRDLKPANIMLTRMGPHDDWVKVLDFGIGKALTASTGGLAVHNLTETGDGGYGTPRYMAPEQIRNKEVGAWTDVYAVALMMCEMITGRPAIPGETTYEVLANQIAEDVFLPAELAFRPIGRVLARASAKTWSDRYQDAMEFHAALDQIECETELIHISSSMTSLPSVMDTGKGSGHRGTAPDLVPVGDTGPQPTASDTSKQGKKVLVAVAALLVLALVAVLIMIATRDEVIDQPQTTGPKATDSSSSADPSADGVAQNQSSIGQPGSEGSASEEVVNAFAELSEGARVRIGARSSQGVAAGHAGALLEPPKKKPVQPDRKADRRKNPKAKEAKEKAATCTVRARSQPVPAAVFANGKKACTSTPCSFDVDQGGSVKVEFRAAGYHTEVKSVNASKESASVSARMVKSL